MIKDSIANKWWSILFPSGIPICEVTTPVTSRRRLYSDEEIGNIVQKNRGTWKRFLKFLQLSITPH